MTTSLTGTNSEDAGRRNRNVVFEAIRRKGPLSRADLARLMSLTPQAVSNIVGELTDAGLIRGAVKRSGGRGQPPVQLAVDPQGGFSVGIYVERGEVLGAAVDIGGTVLAEIARPILQEEPEELLPLIEDVVTALGHHPTATGRHFGVGVSMPAVFNDGALYSSSPWTLRGWNGIRVAERLSEQLNLPTFAENDATAAAIGERLHGVGRGLQNFVYVLIGRGLGAGIICNDQPYRGTAGRAGELGHLIVNPGGRRCTCGKFGCLEAYVSGQAACRAIGITSNELASLGWADLVAAYEDGNPALIKWLDDGAFYLRVAINAVEVMFDPESVVLGGILPRPLIQALVDRLEPLLPRAGVRGPNTNSGPRVMWADAGGDARVLGAAALPLLYDDGLGSANRP